MDASEKERSPWGERIEIALAGRTQKWLSEQSGVNTSTIGGIMSHVEPRAENAVKIAQALGTTVEYLMTGEGGPPPPPSIGSMFSDPKVRAAISKAIEGGSINAGFRQAMAEMAAEGYDLASNPLSSNGKPEPSAYDRAAITLDRAVALTKIEPSEPVRIALMQILFRCPVDAESIALLLEAIMADT